VAQKLGKGEPFPEPGTPINVFEFEESNSLLSFLHELQTFEAIETWVGQLTSRIVMKFDEESEDIHDFIYDYIELG
jgi:hypothetical protein